MSDNTEKLLITGLIVLMVWLFVTGTDVNTHTGGDEDYTITRTSNRTGNIAVTLFGDPTISVDQGSGTSGDKEMITAICPDCGREIVIRP